MNALGLSSEYRVMADKPESYGISFTGGLQKKGEKHSRTNWSAQELQSCSGCGTGSGGWRKREQ